MNRCRNTLWLCLLLCGCAATPRDRQFSGVVESPTAVHAEFLEQYAATRRFSCGYPNSIALTPDGSSVLFLRSGPRSPVQDLYEFDAGTGRERRLLTAEEILRGEEEKLTPEELARRERLRQGARGIATFKLSDDGRLILVPLSGRLYVVERETGLIKELAIEGESPLDASFSPDAKYVSYVKGGELFVIDWRAGKERKLTTGASETVTNGLPEFVAQEEMDRFEGYWWSPDGAVIAYQQTDTSDMERMHIADATHPEIKPQDWPYPRPGKANARVRLGIVPVSGGETTWVQWDSTRYEYLATVKWQKNAPLTVVVQNRRQTEVNVMTVDPVSGSTSSLLIEKDAAWVPLDQKMPHWFPDGHAFLWTTDREGVRQLEMRGRNGRLISALTDEKFHLAGFVDLNVEAGHVTILGHPNPTETQVYRVALAGSPGKAISLTTEPGIHGAVFAEEHGAYVHTTNLMNGQRGHFVRTADGSEVGRLRSVAEEPRFIPNLELTTVGENPSLHCAIVRPRGFDAKKRYPVVVSVYGGPSAQTVRAAPRLYLLQQWIADQGFIVVSIDNRGTPARGRAWERIIKGNFIDVPLNDQAAGLQELGRRYREMDLSRVGIYGWSFGGYFSAMAVMRRPDVFHVGVAGAPVCDWLDYDTHYTERYLGLPQDNPKAYEVSSVLTYAPQLSRPLLIIHGTADDNVFFTHSLKMSDALFRAGKEHDFLALSGFTHMVPEPGVTRRLYLRIVSILMSELVSDQRE